MLRRMSAILKLEETEAGVLQCWPLMFLKGTA